MGPEGRQARADHPAGREAGPEGVATTSSGWRSTPTARCCSPRRARRASRPGRCRRARSCGTPPASARGWPWTRRAGGWRPAAGTTTSRSSGRCSTRRPAKWSGGWTCRCPSWPRTAAPGRAWRFHYPPYISDLRFTPDGSRLLTAHYDGMVRVWAPDAGPEVSRLVGTGHGPAWRFPPTAGGSGSGRGQEDHRLGAGERPAAVGADRPRLCRCATWRSRRTAGDRRQRRPGPGPVGPGGPRQLEGGRRRLGVLADEDGAKAYRVQWACSRTRRPR